ncbi:MAG: O-antigen ligase family protein, partial [Actinomycetota bacterium]|nr:O-antigen ligase family protein [Actinomycetota bacterium]
MAGRVPDAKSGDIFNAGVRAGLGPAIAGSLVGGVLPLSPMVAGAAAGLTLLASMITFHPSMVLLAVLPSAFIPTRVGPGWGDMSLADAILVLGIVTAVPRIRSLQGDVGRLVQLVALYLVALIPVLVSSLTFTAIFEWTHRAALLGGGLLVGVTIARLRQEQPATLLFLLMAAAISVAACITALLTGFGPAFPLGISKNHTGGLIIVGLLILAAAPIMLSARTSTLLATVLFAGLLATRSRAAMLALFLGMAFLLFRRRGNIREARVLVLVAAAGGAVFVSLVSLTAEQALPSTTRISSLSVRAELSRVAYDYWRGAPILGQGIRYYRDEERFEFPEPLAGQSLYGDDEKPHPHNLLLEVLSESGVEGLLATAVLLVGAVVVIVRSRSLWADAAGAALIATIALGSLDVFWVAGRTTVPWVLLGISAATNGGRRR